MPGGNFSNPAPETVVEAVNDFSAKTERWQKSNDAVSTAMIVLAGVQTIATVVQVIALFSGK